MDWSGSSALSCVYRSRPVIDTNARRNVDETPTRFSKCRIFYNHLRAQNVGVVFGRRATLPVPDQLKMDRDFWLAPHLSGCHDEFGSLCMPQVWDAIPRDIRSDPGFLAQAMFRNVNVLHYYWTTNDALSETPFEVEFTVS